MSTTLSSAAFGAVGGSAAAQVPAVRCAQVMLYELKGSPQNTKSASPGAIIRNLATQLEADLAGSVSMAIVPVAYPAVSVLSGIDNRPFGGVQYSASRSRGIARLKDLVAAQLNKCPATTFVFAGYSQGADVVASYLTSGLPARTLKQVAAVALFGDPRFNPVDTAIDAGSFHRKLGPIFGKFRVSGQRHIEGPRPLFPAALAGKTISVCNSGDFICNYSWINATACVGARSWASFDASVLAGRVVRVPRVRAGCEHLRYAYDWPSVIRPGHWTSTDGVANFLAAKISSAWATSWGNAIEANGASGNVTSVSCGSAGNCAAGGYYLFVGVGNQAFVTDEVDGTWNTAIEVPGTASLNVGGDAEVTSVSCASAGNCAAGGYYTSASAGTQPFVANEVNGTWNAAIEVPGTTFGQVTSVSCASAGNCAAGGYGSAGAFVASEVSGTWNAAIELPGMSEVTSVSCASAGNCAAGGYVGGGFEALVASEVNGTWEGAITVPGTASVNAGGAAEVTSVSCASAGNCAAGGYYSIIDNSEPDGSLAEAFVANEVNGTWKAAIEVPGTYVAGTSGEAGVTSVSCTSAGNCVAGGGYGFRPFVAAELHGTWHTAMAIAGSDGRVTSISCASAGNCAIAGDSDHYTAFVASEVNGTWHIAIEVPGTTKSTIDEVAADSASCAPSGPCTIGGYFDGLSNGFDFRHPFVASSR